MRETGFVTTLAGRKRLFSALHSSDANVSVRKCAYSRGCCSSDTCTAVLAKLLFSALHSSDAYVNVCKCAYLR